ncbi:Beta-lactamase hydrolase-like protein [Corynebacterium occultum]|uniref:Beta-lactamase hydrolase-like protein n=1 Tax=Corynebacterium occultum TaxID=2675219 RepID=A0A6B8WKJ3_9CORY|nr:MBL fold metallo-hydrolase [Corynebacterium occultum]QGU06948.1 Beta-lactamase hydrolase-like protein [Corynebacterium occultum]
MTHDVNVHTIFSPWGRFGLYSFFIDAEEPALVDTGVTATVEATIAELAKLGRSIEDVRWILLTHGHIDHLGGAHALWEATGRKAKVALHEKDLPYLRSRRAHVENYLNLRADYIDHPDAEAEQTRMMAGAISGEMEPHVILRGGETLNLGNAEVEVHNIPGHTEGSVAYVIKGQNDVFVGDAVQIHGAANGFPGYEDPEAYRSSLEHLRDVVKPNRMFQGHPYRDATGQEVGMELDRETSQRALQESLDIEARVRGAVAKHGATASDSPYSPFAAIAAELGYEKDPRLEPSPFFTTCHGYLKR